MARSDPKSGSEARRLKIQEEERQKKEHGIKDGIEDAVGEGELDQGCGCGTELAIMKRSQPSVEIKQDAKGNVSFAVKVYDDDPKKARERASTEFGELVKDFEK